MNRSKISKRNLRMGNIEIIVPDPIIRKAGVIDLDERKKFLKPGEEFSDESIRNYILSLNSLRISKNILTEYGCPNIIGIFISADFGGSRGKSLYIEENIDIDLFMAGETVSAYDSSGEEHEVFRGSSQIIDWTAEEGNSLFIVRKIK